MVLVCIIFAHIGIYDLLLFMIRKHATESELLFAGRAFVLVLVVISVIWIPIINASQGSELFDYIQSITSYLAPPICAVYLLAVFWPRCNEPGAFWGLMVGFVVGMTRFVLEFSYPLPPCGSGDEQPPDWWQKIVGDIHYLHFGLLLWGITGVVCVAVSLATKPIPEECLYRLTYWSRRSVKVRVDLDASDRRTPAAEAGHDNLAYYGATAPPPELLPPGDELEKDDKSSVADSGEYNIHTSNFKNLSNASDIDTSYLKNYRRRSKSWRD